MKTLTHESIRALIEPRKADSHKGNYGHALLIAGNLGRVGAAVIAARACLRSGVGLLTVSVPQEERIILQIAIPEAMLIMRDHIYDALNDYSALGIGCGIGTSDNAKELLINILSQIDTPLLLDADALNIISENKDLLNQIPQKTIITPHPKEFDRLFGRHETDSDRTFTAITKAQEYGITLVLKGHKTLITSGGEAFFNTTGNAGLAKGGSGDALTGIITAFLAQGYNAFDAAKIGVFVHGFAADLALAEQSMESLLITDVIECLGKAFQQLSKP
jgi:NAD(P)H-hydrate epimerase